jgi:hypothetical protein
MNEDFMCGVFGGLLAELLGLYKLRTQAPAAFPAYLCSPFYWIVTIGMILAGGGLVWLYHKSGLELKPIIAVNIGVSAPLILGSFVQSKPPEID